MTPNTLFFFLIPFAYLIGSLSSAISTCHLLDLPDPRLQGSMNPGATNVLRIGGKKAAFFTLLGDILKGLIPVLIGQWLNLSYFELGIVGLAAFIGHIYPLYYQFKGGKGVATAIGVYLGINWLSGIIIVLIWLLIAKIVKISSLSALVATFLAPFIFYFLVHSSVLALLLGLMTLFIYWRHRSNITHLLKGSENKI